jgi:hypothetical protein
MYVGYDYAKVGTEIITDDNIWIIMAVLKERIHDECISYQVLVEFVETRLDRLFRESKDLMKKYNALDALTTKMLCDITHLGIVTGNQRKHNPPYSYKTLCSGKKELTGNYVNVIMTLGEPDSEGKAGYEFHANCSACGALLYTANHPSTFKEVFPVERPFCFHCGNKVDASKIETDPDNYYNSAG